MMRMLVTGGTGVLGRRVVDLLRDRADVRVLSRRPSEQPGFVRGNLDTGEGLAGALDGVDVVVHCATSADYRRPQRDAEGTRRLLDAAGGARPHIVYISIVGVDRVPFGYYRGKLATEELIRASGFPWTILRTTQFHDLVLMFLMQLTRLPVVLLPRGMRSQPVEVAEVAEQMTALSLGDPAGRVPDLGGPRVEEGTDLVRAYLAAIRRRRPILPVPVPGRTAAAFRAGGHLLSDGVRGTGTFADYLRSRTSPDGTVTPPYELRLADRLRGT